MGLQRSKILGSATCALIGGLLFTAAPAPAAPPEAPTLTVEAPTKANEEIVNGVLNPGKVGAAGTYELDEYQFLYKASATECKGGSSAPTPPGLSLGGGDEALPAQTLSGLTPDTEYAVCLRAENTKGEATVGPAVSFTTAEATAPLVEAQSAGTEGHVTLAATINPGGAETSCEVKYGKTAALEATPVPCPAKLAAGDTGQPVAVELKGLEPKTEYHFEFVASNEKGTTPAPEEATFKTGPFPPIVLTNEATEVKRARATLGGVFLPSESEKTTYYYEYGTEPCAETCGVKTPVRGPTTELAFGALTEQKVTRLKPGTTYHFWFVASGPGGTEHGEEMTFATAAAEPKEYVFEKNLEGYAFGAPWGVGVNQATKDVYTSDVAANPAVLQQFDPHGAWQSSLAMPGTSGEPARQVAVDNSADPSKGDVYIADRGSLVYKFDRAGVSDPTDEGALIPDATTPTIGEPIVSEPVGVAVNSNGDVYVASAGTGTVAEFSPTGTVINPTLITGLSAPEALAIDAAGNIYVAGRSGTAEYTSAGTCVEACTKINTDLDIGLVVDAAGDVFVSDVTTLTIVEYGPSAGHPQIKNSQLEAEGVFALPTGLALNETNHTLYVADARGPVRIYRFLDVKPVIVKTEPATQVSGSVEALNGKVNPGGQEPAEYYFEYGTSPCLAETCGTVAIEPSQVPLTGDEEIPVSVRLDNLAPNTTYHYRIIGVNEESGVEYGAEQTFTAGGPAPSPPGSAPEAAAAESKTPASSPAYPLLTNIKPVPMPPAPKRLTRAQLLAKALATCNRKPKKKRASCKSQARRKYGPITKGVAKKRRK
jgi:hypothetical protein